MKLIVKGEGELLDYLYNNLDMPKKKIKQYLVHGSIYVNNNKTTKYNYRVVSGMSITIDTTNEVMDPSDNFEINNQAIDEFLSNMSE